MIAYLRGKLIESTLEYVIIDVGGVGYRVFTPASILSRLPETGREVMIHTYHYVREDVMALYGFLEGKELELFEQLISISGIGPKVAMGMLSTVSGAELVQAIIREDLKCLQNLPGVGKKTAQRIIVELKDRLAKTAALRGELPEDMAKITQTALLPGAEDAIQALMALGYQHGEARTAVDRVLVDTSGPSGPEEIIKLALKELVKI